MTKINRRKFRRQTSDNTDGKAEVGRVREEKKREDQSSERVRRQKMQVREKVPKSQNIVFPMICGSGGSRSKLAKAAGAEPCGRCERKNTRRCGAKHISKSKCAKHTRFKALLEVEMSKKCTPLWHEAHLEVKMRKAHQGGSTAEMSKKCTPLWRDAHVEVKMYKAQKLRSTFGS